MVREIILKGLLGAAFCAALLAPSPPDRMQAAGRNSARNPAKRDAPTPTVVAILPQLKARDGRIISLKGYFTYLHVSDPKDMPFPTPQSAVLHGRTVALGKWRWVWRKGRSLTDETRIKLSDEKRSQEREIWWFDGQRTSQLHDTPSGAVVHRQQRGGRSGSIAHFLQMDTGIPNGDGSVGRLLEKAGGVKVVGTEQIRGLKCYRLEYDTRYASEVMHTVLWLAPDRDWLMVRRDNTHTSPTKEWKSRHDTQVIEEFRKHASGIWLPSQMRTSRWLMPAGGKPQWVGTELLRTAGVEVNPVVHDAELVPQMPNGVIVPRPDGTRQVKGDDTSALEEALRKGVFPPPLDPPKLGNSPAAGARPK